MERHQKNDEMFNAFVDQYKKILAAVKSGCFDKSHDKLLCGLEIEYGLIESSTLMATTEQKRDFIIKDNDKLDVELGASQIEQRTAPCDIKGTPIQLLNQVVENDVYIQKMAYNLGLSIVKSGTNPFVSVDAIIRTSKEKYEQVPNYHNKRRREKTQLEFGKTEVIKNFDASIIGITNSVQANIEAQNEVDAIDKLNRSLMIGPMAPAFFSNSNIYEGKDTGFHDARMILWEMSHDIRTDDEIKAGEVTGVGLPKTYYNDLDDYFNRLARKPFILYNPDNALQIGIGINWQDARIKIIKNSLVVEFRPASTQPTAKDNYAAMMFYVGRLLWSQDNHEPLLDIARVKENRDQAMFAGRDAMLFTWDNEKHSFNRLSAHTAADIELMRALEGLSRHIDLDEDTSQMIKDVLQKENQSSIIARSRSAFLQNKIRKDGIDATYLSMQKHGGIV
jgi:gamma-glutamylcysteine synthetase